MVGLFLLGKWAARTDSFCEERGGVRCLLVGLFIELVAIEYAREKESKVVWLVGWIGCKGTF